MNWEQKLSRDELDFLHQIKNYREQVQEESLAVKILKLILLGGFAASCLVAPGLSHIERYFMLNDEKYCRRIYQTIRRLQERGLLTQIENKFYLTHKARLLLSKEKITGIEFIPDTQEIENKKMLVLFDIPENKKESRRLLRKILLKNGFVQLQKSAYISKTSYQKTIKQLARLLDITEHVLYFFV